MLAVFIVAISLSVDVVQEPSLCALSVLSVSAAV